MKRGFTLIELLVVVLIIGILAAIALPQYQKAVERTRSAGALQTLLTVYRASQFYYAEYGKYPASFEEMDITLPWEKCIPPKIYNSSAKVCLTDGNWFLEYNTNGNTRGIYIAKANGPYAGAGFAIFWDYQTLDFMIKRPLCICGKNDTQGEYFCTKIMNGTFIKETSRRYYSLPEYPKPL